MGSRILALLCGSCRFEARGDFPERLLNLAARDNISLWDVRRTQQGITARVIARRYKRLRPLAKKCGLRLRHTEKRGLPFRLLPYRKRSGFVLGFVLFAALMWFMSQFIWLVGYPENLSPELTDALKEKSFSMGVRPGVLRSRLDGEALSNGLELELAGVSWVSVNVMGCRAWIEAREYESLSSTVSSSDACNVLAGKDGLILDVSAREGTAEVAEGDAVTRGELLISGVVDDAMNGVTMVHADGEVYARTEYSFERSIDLTLAEELPTGRVYTIKRLLVCGAELPLYLGAMPQGSFEKEISSERVVILGQELPVELITEKWSELKRMTHIITESEAKRRLCEQVDEALAKEGELEVLSRRESFTVSPTSVTLKADISARENIAKKEIILFD